MKTRAIVIPLIILAIVATTIALYRRHASQQRRLYTPNGTYRCATNLSRIGIALLLFENEHQGRYPMRLEELVAPEGLQPSALTCPFVSPAVSNGFVFVAPGRVAAEIHPNEIVVHEPLSNHKGDGAMALCGDGHVEWLTRADLRDRLASRPTTRATSSTAPSSH